MLGAKLIFGSRWLNCGRLPLLGAHNFAFSEFFKQKDHKELYEYEERKTQYKYYRSLIDLWKKPFERKQLRKLKLAELRAQVQPAPVQDDKLVVHQSAVGIQYPASPDRKFCVVKVDGFQYKLTQDCQLLLDLKEWHQIGKSFQFDEVLLFATDSYTLIGRPTLGTAKVTAIIESISDSDKILVFKKKRRKQYKKSFGSRVPITSCRVVSITHSLTQEVLARAVALE